MALEAAHAPLLLFGALEAIVAVALLALNAGHRGTRAFALLLGLRALLSPLLVLNGSGGAPPAFDAATTDWLRRVTPYLSFALVPATLYFLAVYPSPWRRLPRGLAGPALFATPTAVLWAAYALDHALWFGPAGSPVAVGPLTLITPIGRIAYILAAAVFAVEALRQLPGTRRAGLLAVSAGFALFPLAQVVAFLLYAPPAPRPALYLPFYLVVAALAAALAGLLAARGLRADPALRRASRRYLALLGVVVTTVPLLLLVAPAERGTAGAFLAGAWLLPQPLLCMYALLRFRLFDIDLKAKWTIKQSTVAGAFIGVFFIVSEGAHSLLSESLGPLLGIAAAGALVFAIAPLQRAAERVASVAMPDVRAPDDLGPGERLALYRDQVRFAWADGSLSHDERLILNHLRERLGLALEEAARLELEVAQELSRERAAASA